MRKIGNSFFSSLLEGAERKEPPSASAATRLLILTGCRLSEILSLRWEWIDFQRGCLVLPDSKTGAKTVPLGAPAFRALAELPHHEGSPYVLPAERGDRHFVGIQKPWQGIRAAAGLSDVRIHDLRHSFASILPCPERFDADIRLARISEAREELGERHGVSPHGRAGAEGSAGSREVTKHPCDSEGEAPWPKRGEVDERLAAVLRRS
jgi:Phage integrase family